jgi:hypothetical protein
MVLLVDSPVVLVDSLVVPVDSLVVPVDSLVVPVGSLVAARMVPALRKSTDRFFRCRGSGFVEIAC